MTDSRYAILFEPVAIGPVTAPNRFFAVPHATGHGWLQPHGAIALRATKAEGGWGTVAVQMTEISPDSDMANHPMERIWDDSDLPRHAAQVDAIKKHGALAAIELAHGGMRARNITTGLPAIGPSGLPILRPEVPVQARAMSIADIRRFRQAHQAAVRRAVAAGYDLIYVYAAHDLSILSHFLSRRTNHRSDEYGGSLANRMRLLREVVQDTLEIAHAQDRAVVLRFSVAEPSRDNGLTHDGEGREVVEALAELPDLWDVNLSGWPDDSATARFTQEGFQLPFTDFVKSITSKPVVGVGRFTSPDAMVSIIRNGRLDFIGGARPSIADPFLPVKIRDGREDEIRECIGCNICVSMDGYGLPVRCTQNPTVSEEWRRNWHPEVTPLVHNRKNCLIVGAGPAGLECASLLLKAGHRVTVSDAAAVAGGRVSREATLPELASWLRVRDHREHQLSQSADANLYLQSPLTADDVANFDADHVVVACGAHWRRDGVGSENSLAIDFGETDVFTPDDIVDGKTDQLPPRRVLVYDDDHFYMASVVAERLSQQGHRVQYVTPLPTVASWTDLTLDQPRIIERLVSLGVELTPNAMLQSQAKLVNTLNGDAIDAYYDAIVMVGARKPNDELATALTGRVEEDRLYLSGDCLVPGIIQAAVLSGHAVAREILTQDANPALAAINRRAQIRLD